MTKIDTSTIPHDTVRRRHWVRAQLLLRGLTLADLGRQLGVSRDAVSYALRHPYPRIERAIADALDLHPADIWPERYDPDGKPNRRMGRPPKKSLDGQNSALRQARKVYSTARNRRRAGR